MAQRFQAFLFLSKLPTRYTLDFFLPHIVHQTGKGRAFEICSCKSIVKIRIAAFFNSGGIQSRAMLEEINRCMTDLRSMRKDIAELAGDYRGNLKTRRR